MKPVFTGFGNPLRKTALAVLKARQLSRGFKGSEMNCFW